MLQARGLYTDIMKAAWQERVANTTPPQKTQELVESIVEGWAETNFDLGCSDSHEEACMWVAEAVDNPHYAGRCLGVMDATDPVKKGKFIEDMVGENVAIRFRGGYADGFAFGKGLADNPFDPYERGRSHAYRCAILRDPVTCGLVTAATWRGALTVWKEAYQEKCLRRLQDHQEGLKKPHDGSSSSD